MIAYIILHLWEHVKIVRQRLMDGLIVNLTEENQVWEIQIVADKPKKSKKNHVTKRYCKEVEREEISQNLLHYLPSN